MPRRSVLTEAQHAELFALPESEPDLVRYWTLSSADLRVFTSRRRPHNRLGFALQLCALRYPGRLLKPGEFIPDAPLRFVGDQLGVEPDALADYATRGPTRYEQLDTLREVFGFRQLSRPIHAELQAWLLPIALTMTGGIDLARILMEEFRRRQIIVPGITSLERMVSKALLDAERNVGNLPTGSLTSVQCGLLDSLLLQHNAGRISILAWIRQPPGRPGRRAFAEILERLSTLRAIGLEPVLLIAWLMPIVTLGLALLLLGIVIALGRTAWPRWFAALANPVSLVAIGMLIARILPEPAHTWLDGAAFNLGWLVVYAVSTALLWNGGRSPVASRDEAA